MESLAILGGTIITPFREIERGTLLIANHHVTAIGSVDEIKIPEDAVKIDATGKYLTPGYIDSHTHGGFGFDYMDVTPVQLDKLLASLPSTGVTGVVPTIASTNLTDQKRMIRTLLDGLQRSPRGTKILGIHLEGPYLAQEKRGAQPRDALRMPDISEMKELIQSSDQNIRLVTLAPELPGGLELVEYLTAQGIVTSAGHTVASYEVIQQADEKGLSRAAHLFNGMEGLHHRKPGAVGAALTLDGISAEVILDGKHLDPRIVKLVVQAKGVEKVILITDSMEAMGKGDGIYIRPGNRKVIVKNGEARLESGSLAGSVLTMDLAVQNAVNLVGLPITAAVRMASFNPADNLGIKDRGSLEVGKIADVLILDDDLSVETVMIDGEIVFQKLKN